MANIERKPKSRTSNGVILQTTMRQTQSNLKPGCLALSFALTTILGCTITPGLFVRPGIEGNPTNEELAGIIVGFMSSVVGFDIEGVCGANF